MKQFNLPAGGGNNNTNETTQNKYGGFDGLRALAAIGIAVMHYLANIDEGIAVKLKDSGYIYSDIVPFSRLLSLCFLH